MNVVVTGGTGLLGSHLIEALLQAGYSVKALYRTAIPPLSFAQNVQWVKGDISDVLSLEDAFENADEVYHCAATVSFNPRKKLEMFKVNVEGTANVVNAALLTGVKKLLYVSSVAALGRIREGEMIHEGMNWTEETSNSTYGETKYLAEMEVWRGTAEGLPAVIVNPSIILGKGDWNKGSSAIFKSAYNEFKYFTEGVSGFVDVLDVVQAIIRLMQSGIINERFIVSGHNVPYKEIFTLAAKCFNKKPPSKKVSAAMASVVWRIEALKTKFASTDPLLTKETAATAQAKVFFSNQKLLTALPGFAFTPVDKTISRICSELKAHYKL